MKRSIVLVALLVANVALAQATKVVEGKIYPKTAAGAPLTPGSVGFVGTGGLLSQDNANLFWDDAANRLGIGTTVPTQPLSVAGVIESTAGGFKFPDTTVQTTAAAAVSPGGADGAVQYNNGGAFGGDATRLSWDDTTNILSVKDQIIDGAVRLQNSGGLLNVVTPSISDWVGINAKSLRLQNGNEFIDFGSTGQIIKSLSDPTKIQVAGDLARSTVGTDSVFGLIRRNSGSVFPQVADFNIGRYLVSGNDARTRMDLLMNNTNTSAVSDTTVMTWLANGNVGIGNTAPTTKLHVEGDMIGGSLSTEFAGADPTVTVYKEDADTVILGAQGNSNELYFGFGSSAAGQKTGIRVSNSNDNYIGINYSGFPGERLAVNGNILAGDDVAVNADKPDSTVRASHSTTGNSFKGGRMVLKSGNSSGNNTLGVDLLLQGGASTGNVVGGGVSLQYTPSGASGTTVNTHVEGMRLSNAGSVGIGDSTPDARLDVQGGVDEIQSLVTGNSTQTADIAVIENSAGTDLVNVQPDGAVVISETGGNGGNVVHACNVVTGTVADPTTDCAAGEIATGGAVDCGAASLFVSLQAFTGGSPATGYQGSCSTTLGVTDNTSIVVQVSCCDY